MTAAPESTSNRQWRVILGYPRSGTTFLFESLRRADHVQGTSKAYASHISAIYRNEQREDLRQAIRWSFSDMLDFFLEESENSRADTVADFLKRHISPRELVEGVLHQRTLPIGLYKETFLAFAPDLPFDSLRNSRIVHIYRDGRDAADSLVRKYDTLSDENLANPRLNELLLTRPHGEMHVPWWVEVGADEHFIAASPYVRAVWMWKVMVASAHDFATRPDVVSTARVTEVKYEELVRDSMLQGERVAAHLGIPVNRRVRQAFGQAHARSVAVHKRRDPTEILAATTLAEAELSMLGYL